MQEVSACCQLHLVHLCGEVEQYSAFNLAASPSLRGDPVLVQPLQLREGGARGAPDDNVRLLLLDLAEGLAAILSAQKVPDAPTAVTLQVEGQSPPQRRGAADELGHPRDAEEFGHEVLGLVMGKASDEAELEELGRLTQLLPRDLWAHEADHFRVAGLGFDDLCMASGRGCIPPTPEAGGQRAPIPQILCWHRRRCGGERPENIGISLPQVVHDGAWCG